MFRRTHANTTPEKNVAFKSFPVWAAQKKWAHLSVYDNFTFLGKKQYTAYLQVGQYISSPPTPFSGWLNAEHLAFGIGYQLDL
jgi:hypothetical protein